MSLLLLLSLQELNLVNLLHEQVTKQKRGYLEVRAPCPCGRDAVGWGKCSSFSHIHAAAMTLLLKGGAGRWGQREKERGGERCSAVWKSDASGQGPPSIRPDLVLCSITTKSMMGTCPALRVYVKCKVILVSSYFLN